MKDASKPAQGPECAIGRIREHLEQAQELMDAINPHTIFGARLQQLIDELGEQSGGGRPRQPQTGCWTK